MEHIGGEYLRESVTAEEPEFRRQNPGDRRENSGDRIQETEERIQETESRRQEINVSLKCRYS
ncbi:MAG: hypothetical protein NTZ78_12655 [Candidatus Aureabacteria bacterium]|nr:hypothetical protein [Candidatus Auribacterota bacterium]